MMCYSVQARDRVIVKDCGFLSFAKIWVRILVEIEVKT